MTRILIVDDEFNWRERLHSLLSGKGYDVTVVSNDVEALFELIENRFDLAIIDVRLHKDGDDKDSLSLTRVLKQLAVRMNVIWLTDHSVSADQLAKPIRLLGTANFIEKTELEGASGLDLATVVKQILGKPPFASELDQLSLSLELGQPIMIRIGVTQLN